MKRTIIPRSPISALIQDKFAPLLKSEPKRILDLCTGSGCIAIATAEAFPEAEVDAVDLFGLKLKGLNPLSKIPL